jgi:hypothetical protein
MHESPLELRFGAPGKSGPADFALYGPRPQLLRDFTKEKGHGQDKTQDQPQKPSDGVATTRGCVADAFFGASPVVASALGAAPGATPARLIEPTMGGSRGHSKPGLSTLLRTGSFYFALTTATEACHRHVNCPALLTRELSAWLAASGRHGECWTGRKYRLCCQWESYHCCPN